MLLEGMRLDFRNCWRFIFIIYPMKDHGLPGHRSNRGLLLDIYNEADRKNREMLLEMNNRHESKIRHLYEDIQKMQAGLKELLIFRRRS